jgi:Heterokaryon incompatibility protein (HET)
MDERRQQVTLMKDIYKKASRVVIFLGLVAKAKEANLACEMIHYLVAQKHLYSATGDDFYNSATKKSTPG